MSPRAYGQVTYGVPSSGALSALATTLMLLLLLLCCVVVSRVEAQVDPPKARPAQHRPGSRTMLAVLPFPQTNKHKTRFPLSCHNAQPAPTGRLGSLVRLCVGRRLACRTTCTKASDGSANPRLYATPQPIRVLPRTNTRERVCGPRSQRRHPSIWRQPN